MNVLLYWVPTQLMSADKKQPKQNSSQLHVPTRMFKIRSSWILKKKMQIKLRSISVSKMQIKKRKLKWI